MSFLGRESYEKSFNRWLKVFDTFPEGMAIVKDDGSIMYSNNSLAELLEYKTLPNSSSSKAYSQVGVKSDPSTQTMKMLQNVQIKKYEQDEGDYALDSARGPAGGSNNKNSVWDFITKNTQRGFYEVTNSATSLANFGTT